MSTGWVWHERYAWHDARGLIDTLPREALFEPEPSLESGTTKRRLRNLVDASGLLAQLTEIPARPATDDELCLLHDRDYVQRLRAASAAGGGDAGGFTPFGRWSYEIAALAAGGCLEAVDAVMAGRVRNAYALVRPPGHHAGPAGGAGYCLFSNVALSVLRLRHEHRLARVAVVDWDVHHGNGTQAAFWSDGSVLTISIHQEDLYPPGSGLVHEIGEGDGTGANINVPLPAGAGRAAYLATLDRVVGPALDRFAPEFILVANGLDASLGDPLGRMNLTSECFALMTERLMSRPRSCATVGSCSATRVAIRAPTCRTAGWRSSSSWRRPRPASSIPGSATPGRCGRCRCARTRPQAIERARTLHRFRATRCGPRQWVDARANPVQVPQRMSQERPAASAATPAPRPVRRVTTAGPHNLYAVPEPQARSSDTPIRRRARLMIMPTPRRSPSPAAMGAGPSIAFGWRCGRTSSERRAGRRCWRSGGPDSPVGPRVSPRTGCSALSNRPIWRVR